MIILLVDYILQEGKDQETDHPKTPLEPSTQSGLTSNQDEPDPLLQNRLSCPKCLDDGQAFILVTSTNV